MLKQIEKLRQKPEIVRKQVVLWSTVSITGVVFLVWLSIIGVKLSENSSSIEIPVQTGQQNVSDSLSEIKEEFSSFFEDLEKENADIGVVENLENSIESGDMEVNNGVQFIDVPTNDNSENIIDFFEQ